MGYSVGGREDLVVVEGLFAGSLRLSMGGLRIEGAAGVEIHVPPSVWLGDWHHVVVSTDGADLSLFVDGAVVGVPVAVPVRSSSL